MLRPQASSPGAMPPPSAGGVPGRSSSAPLGGSSQVPAEVAAMSNEHEGDGERRESFVTRIMKPLQDFGFGRSSFWEGGVGLFVFSGIGECVGACSCACSRHSMHVFPSVLCFGADCTVCASWCSIRHRAGQLGAQRPAGQARQGLPGITGCPHQHVPCQGSHSQPGCAPVFLACFLRTMQPCMLAAC